MHPENTLDGFRAALSCGADGVELDVRMTIDERLMLRHDDEMDAGAAVTTSTASAVLAREPHVPDLAAALQALAPARRVVVEVKPDAGRTARVAELVVRVIQSAGRAAVMASSFDAGMVAALRERLPGLRTGQLVGRVGAAGLEGVLERAAEDGHEEVHLHRSLLGGAAIFDQAAARGLQVVAWTVNDVDEARELRDRGLHAVITDVPDVFVRELA